MASVSESLHRVGVLHELEKDLHMLAPKKKNRTHVDPKWHAMFFLFCHSYECFDVVFVLSAGIVHNCELKAGSRGFCF